MTALIIVTLLAVIAYLLARYIIANEKRERDRQRTRRKYYRYSWDDKDREDGWWRGL